MVKYGRIVGEKIKPQRVDVCENEHQRQNALQAIGAIVLKSGHLHINLCAAMRCRGMEINVLRKLARYWWFELCIVGLTILSCVCGLAT